MARAAVTINERTVADAAEFGIHVRQGGWRLGLLVARNVTRSKPGSTKIVARATIKKVSATQFAKSSGTSADRVLRYLDAWKAAADQGHVPMPDTLTPGEEVDINMLTLPEWSTFYDQMLEPLRVQRAEADRQAEMAAEHAMTLSQRHGARMTALAAAIDEAAAHPAEDATVILDEAARFVETGELDPVPERTAPASEYASGGDFHPTPAEGGWAGESAQRRAHGFKVADVGAVLDQLKWATRRLYDLARDEEWLEDGRAQIAAEVVVLSQQLRSISGVIKEPAGRVSDAELDKLLNARG